MSISRDNELWLEMGQIDQMVHFNDKILYPSQWVPFGFFQSFKGLR